MRFIANGHINFIFTLTLLCVAMVGNNPFQDPDTAWHLATGDLIRSLGTVPFKDTWSFTAGEEIWYNLAWIFDVIIVYMVENCGFSSVYTFTVLIFAASIMFSALYSLRQGANAYIVIIMIPLAVLCTKVGLSVRPNMFSILFTVIFYIILQKYRKQPKIEYLAILPIIMLIWVNTHGGFLLAFLLLGLFGYEALIEFNRKKFRELSLITALCLIAVLINPYGVEIYYGAYRTISGDFGKYIDEWQPANVMHNFPMAFLLSMGLICAGIKNPQIKFIDRLLVIIMLFMSLSSARHIVVASLLMLPYICICLSSYLYSSPIGNYIRKREESFLNDMQEPDIRNISFCVVIVALILISFPLRFGLIKEDSRFIEEKSPIAEAEYIEQNYPNLRFYNSYGLGGYLTYIWRGRVKVFVDGRANSLYSDDLLEDSMAIYFDKGFTEISDSIISRYKLDGFIIDAESSKAWDRNPKLKAVYRGKVATVYLINK